MKKIFFLLLLVLFSSTFFAQSSYANLYINLYNSTSNWSSRLSPIQDFTKKEPNSPECLEFMHNVANDLLKEAKLIPNPGEKAAWDNSAKITISYLTEKGTSDDAEIFWKIFQVTKNPTIKGLALQGMGKLQSPLSANRIQLLLESMNNGNYSERLYAEEIAQGAIIGLEALKDPSSYRALFFASNTWYSNATKKMAQKALDSLILDESSSISKEMVEMVSDPELSLSNVLTILRKAKEINLSENEKSEVALAALIHAQTVLDSLKIKRTRNTIIFEALDTLDDNPKNLPALRNCLKETHSVEEKVSAVKVLGKYKSEEATAILGDLVEDINNKMELGFFRHEVEEPILYEIINSLGKIKNQKSIQLLSSIVSISGYSNGIKQQARNAVQASL